MNALVSNIIQPLIAAVGGNAEVKGLSVIVGGQTIDFGGFISAVISFLITALAVFAIVKGANTLNDLKDLAARKAGARQAGRRRETRPSRASAPIAGKRSPTTPPAARTARPSSQGTRTRSTRLVLPLCGAPRTTRPSG